MKKFILCFAVLIIACSNLVVKYEIKEVKKPIVCRKFVETRPKYFVLIHVKDSINRYIKVEISKENYEKIKLGDYFSEQKGLSKW